MKIAAVSPISKITSNVYQNSRRFFSFKFEMTPANRLAEQSEESKAPAPEEPQKSINPSGNFRYNVHQPRTTPIQRPNTAGDVVAAQKQNVRAAIEEQHLQPAMLPEYFQKQMEKNLLVNPESEPINQGHNLNSQRRFQVSKTYANAILPLKSVKLANPFPEPVKMMMSRTVSDDEKAEQMLAEARSQRTHSERTNKATNFRSFSSDVKRWYSKTVSTDTEKCPKAKKATRKGGCPKMRLANCPPQARTRCDRLSKQTHCKKQEAPYPAYSEFCHEDPDEKPSECKMCPWKPDENPHFKPQKKKFHTYSALMVRRSGLEMDWTRTTEETSPVVEEAEAEAEAEEGREGMQCDLRKPPCDRPKNRRCPPTKEKKKEEKKSKKVPKKAASIPDSIDEVILTERAQNFLSLSQSKSNKPHGPGGHCKIKKFKFPRCDVKIKREKSLPEGDNRCPPKKKPHRIVDCPPDEETKCDSVETVVEEYIMKDKSTDKRKCPKIDMRIYKEEDEEEEDRCKKKKKDNTKICPGDLLKKKRRQPRKKTSGALTPVESKIEQPQPTRTI